MLVTFHSLFHRRYYSMELLVTTRVSERKKTKFNISFRGARVHWNVLCRSYIQVNYLIMLWGIQYKLCTVWWALAAIFFWSFLWLKRKLATSVNTWKKWNSRQKNSTFQKSFMSLQLSMMPRWTFNKKKDNNDLCLSVTGHKLIHK